MDAAQWTLSPAAGTELPLLFGFNELEMAAVRFGSPTLTAHGKTAAWSSGRSYLGVVVQPDCFIFSFLTFFQRMASLPGDQHER